MTPRPLDRLIRPRSIAVFGGKEARRVIYQCEKMGFAGDIWPVHPREDDILGRKCYRSVADLPAAPDASFVGVNRQLTIDVIRDLSTRGAGGAVCYASGFREAVSELADGDDLQTALVEAAGDMPILGPNCYGFINMLDGALLWPDQHGMLRVDKGVAVLTQSSNIACNISMQQRDRKARRSSESRLSKPSICRPTAVTRGSSSTAQARSARPVCAWLPAVRI